MTAVTLLLGLAAGSFLHVIARRYDPDKFLIGRDTVRGRSRCDHCGSPLRWFELIPLVSFAIQRGRCRSCGAPLSIEYPAIEIISALLVLFVSSHIAFLCYGGAACAPATAIWVIAFLTLLLVALIDLRLTIIPDELNVLLAVLGIIFSYYAPSLFLPGASFIGTYALVLSPFQDPWISHISGAVFGIFFFLSLYAVTRGRGMGMGDVKLAGGLGLLFGWPDMLLVTILSFIVGSVVGGGLILRREKSLKSFVPFGPFLAAGALLVFFFGHDIVAWYFRLFPLS